MEKENKNEVWKDVNGYENMYMISNLGRVKSLARVTMRSNGVELTVKERIMKNSLNNAGYYLTGFSKNGKTESVFIHRLLAQHFIPNPDCLDVVNHKDGNPLNNFITNLEWTNNRENISHGKNKMNNSSVHTGVSWNKRDNKWRAYVQINGKQKYLGYFEDEYQASLAYQQALIDYGLANKYAV